MPMHTYTPPTFLGLGSQRCGSSWLWSVLNNHPHVRVSKKKEVNFFTKMILEPGMDLAAYGAHFAPAEGDAIRAVRGEISPQAVQLRAGKD